MIRRALAAWWAEIPAAAKAAVLPGAVGSGFLLTLYAVWFTPIGAWVA